MTEFPSGCLGKLPLHGDFIRYNAASPEVKELDEWIQGGIYEGYQKLESRWDSSFDAAPISRFIFCHPRTKRLVTGLFKPSVDKAGRRYPFLVYTIIESDGLGNEVGYLPWAIEPFLLKATELADWSDTAINLKSFLANFSELRFSSDLTEARKRFAQFVLGTNMQDYWTRSFGSADDDRRFAAVQFTSWGSDVMPPESAAVRLPVSDMEAEAAFWLELSRRLSGNGRLPTMTFWNAPAGDTPSRLHLCYGALTPRFFLPFALPTRAEREVQDMSNPGQIDASLVDRAKTHFDEVLSDPSLKLSDLLQRLPRAKGV